MAEKSPSGSGSNIPIVVIVVVSVVAVVGLLGLRSYVSGSFDAPTPTLMASAVAVLPSPTATVTLAPEATAERIELPATNTPLPTVTSTPSRRSTVPIQSTSSQPTAAPTHTATPTSRPQLNPTLAITDTQGFGGAIPSPVPTFEVPLDTTNILLLGNDIGLDKGVGRTDTMIIVSVNRDGPTASMVSLPRDLYVYIPGWTMNRLNTALSRGSSSGYPGGSVAQLTDTILYNFGVPIHFYAQIDYQGFKDGVDLIGGIEVPVSCQVRDWRLKSPDLNPENEDNWEMYTLPPGIHHMDGDLALWYARSRRGVLEFERGRRQQQLLRLMLNQGVDLNLLPQIPEIWSSYKDNVRTNIDIGRLLQLAALAPAVRENGVQHLYLVGDKLQPYVVPSSGAQVQLPVWENMEDTFKRLFLPPALNRAARPPITVEIVNHSGSPDMALLAADNLAWYGFEPVIRQEQGEEQNETTVEYFAQNTKGSFDWLLSWIFDKGAAEVELVTDVTHDYNYRVVLGSNYDPCVDQLRAPLNFLP